MQSILPDTDLPIPFPSTANIHPSLLFTHYPALNSHHLLNDGGRDDLSLETVQIRVGLRVEDIIRVGDLAVAEERVAAVKLVGVDKIQLEQKLSDLSGVPASIEVLVEALREAVEVELADVVEAVDVGVAETVALKFDQELFDVVVVEAGVELAVERVDVKGGKELGNVVGGERVAAEQAVDAVAVDVAADVAIQQGAEILSLFLPMKLLDVS